MLDVAKKNPIESLYFNNLMLMSLIIAQSLIRKGLLSFVASSWQIEEKSV